MDRTIAEVAGRQHGVVARRQLLEMGLTRHEIGHRLTCGNLIPIHRATYAVGHRSLTRDGRWIAAVLAAGPDAVLSHHPAAALWGMRAAGRARIDVTVPRALPARKGIRWHRTHLPTDERTTQRGIPVTTPPRTLLDLAADLSRDQLEKAVNEAEVQRLTDALSLYDLLKRHPRRAGTRALRALIEAARLGATLTRSELEARFLTFLDDAVLPRPETNVRIELGATAFEVDCVWRDQGLIAELDGHATHGTRTAYERDRARDRGLQAAGWRVIRITWRQLHTEADRVASDLGRLLRLP